MVETFTTELLDDLMNVLCKTNKQYFQTESASLWQLQKLNCVHIISSLLSFSWHWSWLLVILLPTFYPNVNLQQDHLPSGPDCHSICSKNFDSVREILNFEEKFPILTKVGFLHPRYQKFCSALFRAKIKYESFVESPNRLLFHNHFSKTNPTFKYELWFLTPCVVSVWVCASWKRDVN